MEEEKTLGRKYIVSISMQLEFMKEIENNECDNTLNYGGVSQFLIEK